MAPLLAEFRNDGAISTPPYRSFYREARYSPYNSSLPPKSSFWDTHKSSSLYKIDCWGAPYFSLTSSGTIAVRPHGYDTKSNEEIDIMKVVKKVLKPKTRSGLGLCTPAIFRFPDVLRDRLQRLQASFDKAIKTEGYNGCFRGVFPVKCNQDRFVVENIVEFGMPSGFGLEAGSKPELLLAMASLSKGSPHALLICNGYKDAHYVSLTLIARRIGLNCVIVLEQEEELELVLSMARELCIDPVLGLRARLNTKHAGHFGDTSGEKGKFGLSCSEIVATVNKLQRANKLDCLQLLHFHIGSQIPSLPIVNDGMSEAAHIYCELAHMGANMQYIDIGGGLGIDYDGTNSTNSDMSVGYTMEEYASEVVQAVNRACILKGVKQPTLCSESGRALVSHHSVLVFDVLSSSVKDTHMASKGVSLENIHGLPKELKKQQRELIKCARECEHHGALEHAKVLKKECTELFKHGQIGLSEMAAVDDIFDMCSLVDGAQRGNTDHFDAAYASGTDNYDGHNAVYHINLSIFKSMPDTWAIGQLFPIMPLHRLDKEPTVRAILSDLTCDSDGKVSKFVGKDKQGRSLNYLRVHELEERKPYYMGMFLGGAYQEALGGLHNLFGCPCVVNVCRNVGNGFNVSKASYGQTASDVLRLMQYEPSDMLRTLQLHVQKALHHEEEDDDDAVDGDAKVKATMRLIQYSFTSSTYLSTNNHSASICKAYTQDIAPATKSVTVPARCRHSKS